MFRRWKKTLPRKGWRALNGTLSFEAEAVVDDFARTGFSAIGRQAKRSPEIWKTNGGNRFPEHLRLSVAKVATSRRDPGKLPAIPAETDQRCLQFPGQIQQTFRYRLFFDFIQQLLQIRLERTGIVVVVGVPGHVES